MSWSFQLGKGVPVEDFPAAIDAAHEAADIARQNAAGVSGAACAVRVVKEIVAAGIIASAGQKVAASLSGHKDGESPHVGDSINISVYQVA